MQPSIKHHRENVHACFQRALAAVDCQRRCTLERAEREVWSLLLELGRALMALFLARAVTRTRARSYRLGLARFEVTGKQRTTELGTRFGKLLFTRPVARPASDKRGACDLPVDRELGLNSGFSLDVVMLISRLAAQMAFASARNTFEQFLEWAPSPRAVLRMVDGTGQRAREFLQQAPAPADDGEVLVIQVDGKGAPTISTQERHKRSRPHRKKTGNNRRHRRRCRRHETPRVRRKPGEKSKNANMAIVGAIYTMRRDPDGKLEGPLNKRLVATFRGHRALFEWLHREAIKRGYGSERIKLVHFLADGANAIWALQQEFFPDAEVGLDWYHVDEKLWAVAKCIQRSDRQRRHAWVREQQKRLLRGSFDPLMTTLGVALQDTPRTGPGNKYRRQLLSKTIAHFENNRSRMKYRRLRRLDLDIATGVIEGAVRHLVGIRFDGPGMRWGDRRERLLHLRCILLNGQWGDFHRFIASDASFKLPSQPLPARPYDAQPKKVA